MRKNPFSKVSYSLTAIPQGDRQIWFKSIGAITPNINPYDLQELQQRQSKLMSLIFEAISNYATEQGIGEEEARLAFFPERKADDDEDVAPVAPIQPLDYLGAESKAKLMALMSDDSVSADARTVSKLQIKTASLLIRYRMAFEVELESLPSVGDTAIKVVEPWFEVKAGDRIKFGNAIVEVKGAYVEDVGTIPTTKIKTPITETIGYLMNKDGNDLKFGYDNWSEEDTEGSCPIDTIRELYAFYIAEASGGKYQPIKVVVDREVQEQPPTSPQLIGETSIGDSDTSDATMTDSVQTTLETALIG